VLGRIVRWTDGNGLAVIGFSSDPLLKQWAEARSTFLQEPFSSAQLSRKGKGGAERPGWGVFAVNPASVEPDEPQAVAGES
jgi:hypothetical protein